MCAQTPLAEIELGDDKRAASKARAFLRKFACEHCLAGVETAELLISEVVTNSIRHARPPYLVVIECKRGNTLEVRVTDGSRRAPSKRDPDVWSESGRGVALVNDLSKKWGVKKSLRGKTVWFQVSC
jgi:anti-sigma regulatory factor (Ser/Thr protein kinase)